MFPKVKLNTNSLIDLYYFTISNQKDAEQIKEPSQQSQQ